MKNTIHYLLLFVSLNYSISSYATSVTYPSSGNHLHTTSNGTVRSTLTPDPVTNFSEFFSLSGVSTQAVNTLNAEFGDWTFDFLNDWGTGAGNLTIDTYKATTPFTAFAGAELAARYNKGIGDPTNLRWIQLVDPSSPFDPDETFSTTTGASTGNGPIEACDGAFVDPCHNDGTDGGPFYWNSDEINDYTSGTNSFGVFDLAFSDLPQLAINSTNSPNSLAFELYLVAWDGDTSVDFISGVQWGFEGIVVPIPASAWLLVTGLLALVGVARRKQM